ncbi:MAG: glycosyltransferase family 2 protein [Patescibacteria group bacterium]|jgi:GT2 family glycosyltransferase
MQQTKLPLVSVIILTHNSKQYLLALFFSLQQQTYKNLEIIVVDSASTDDTVVWLKQQNILSNIKIITCAENIWFAKGNNLGAQAAKGDYLLFSNDDIVLECNYIELLVQLLQKNHKIGMISGKLLKLINGKPSGIIDSTGLVINHYRKVINRGENELDRQQFEQAGELFGVTGALMMVSKLALNNILEAGQFFDEDFVAYKEDIDVSWRMQRASWQVYYSPTAIAYHARTVQQQNLSERKSRATIVKKYSYRNHIWLLIKNEYWRDFLRDGVFIIGYEIIKLVYICLKEPATLKCLPQLLSQIKHIWHKRKLLPKQSLGLWIQ